MAGEWVRAGGKAGGRILFEADGDLRVARVLDRREERIAAGPGVVAVLDDGSGPVVGWIVKGRFLKGATVGLIAPAGIMGMVHDPDGKLGAIIMYRMGPGANAERRALAFQSPRIGEFTHAVAAFSPHVYVPGVGPPTP